MPPFLRFRLQLALLAMAMVAAPCSSPYDEDLDADLHFAMYAGGLDGFGQEPSYTLGDVGLQQGHQHMFSLNEQPDFAMQEHSFIYPNEACSVTMENHDALHPNLMCPLQDHTGILHGFTNHNLSPVQEYSFPQNVNSPSHNERSHARHPFSTDGSSQVAYRSNQNNLIPAQEQTTPIVLHGNGHDTLPTNSESGTFHEILEVIDSPGPGYDTLDPRQIHHDSFKAQEPQANIVSPIQNVQEIDSVRLYPSEPPQENTENAQFIQGKEQISSAEDLTQSTAAYEQRTRPMPLCTLERQAATMHDFGGKNPVYGVTGIDTGTISMLPISNAKFFEDNVTNTPLEIHSQRVREVVPSMKILFHKKGEHCSGNCAKNRQYHLPENSEIGFEEDKSDSTRQYKTSSTDASMDHQKQENDFSSIEQNNSCQWIFPSFSAPPTDIRPPIRYTENVQRETKNTFKHKSSIFPSITNTVQPPITTKQESVTVHKHPQESDGQLQATNYQIQPLVYHQAGAQESPRSVQVQPLFNNEADVQESPRSFQIQPLVPGAQETPRSRLAQLLVNHHANNVQESPSSVHTQPLVNNQERPKGIENQLLCHHQTGVQETPISVKMQPIIHHQHGVQESQMSIQTQSPFNQQAGVQESPSSVQTQAQFNQQAGVQESQKTVQTKSQFHKQASAQESPRSVQTQAQFNQQAGVQESQRTVQTKSQFHKQAGVQESQRTVQTKTQFHKQASAQEIPRSVQTQYQFNQQTDVQESQRTVQTNSQFHKQASVQESTRSVQTQSQFNQQTGVQESPRSVQTQAQFNQQAGVQESQRSVQTQSQFHQQASDQQSPLRVQTQLPVHQAGVQQSRIGVTQPQLITHSKNDFQQRPILPNIYSNFDKDPNYLTSLKSTLGTREKMMAYDEASRSNVKEAIPKTPATYYVPVVVRDIPPRPPVPEILMSPRQLFQSTGEPLMNTVNPEEFILPPTLSEIPYDTFPYSESRDAEEKPPDSEQTPEDSKDCGDVRQKHTSRCATINVTKPAYDAGANGTDAVLVAPTVIEDIKIGNVTESDTRSKLKKKAKRRYEVTGNNRTATVQEKSVAVTTVSRLGPTGGEGDAGSAVQLCQCELGKGCSCQSCSTCVKNLCRTVGLRVAEDVGEFVKKEAVSALKTLRNLKISA